MNKANDKIDEKENIKARISLTCGLNYHRMETFIPTTLRFLSGQIGVASKLKSFPCFLFPILHFGTIYISTMFLFLSQTINQFHFNNLEPFEPKNNKN